MERGLSSRTRRAPIQRPVLKVYHIAPLTNMLPAASFMVLRRPLTAVLLCHPRVQIMWLNPVASAGLFLLLKQVLPPGLIPIRLTKIHSPGRSHVVWRRIPLSVRGQTQLPGSHHRRPQLRRRISPGCQKPFIWLLQIYHTPDMKRLLGSASS